jgi:subtilase family serine protease
MTLSPPNPLLRRSATASAGEHVETFLSGECRYMSRDTRRMFPVVPLVCLAILLIVLPAFAGSVRNVRALPNTRVLGAEDQSKQIAVTFWLNQHNKAEFDDLVRQMYDRNSPRYHHWLALNEYRARFAPTAGDLALVRQHLEAHNLQVVASDRLNHYITARGTVADVQRATGVQLNRVSMNGEVHRLPSSEPVIPGAAGELVYAVQGLADLNYRNYSARQIDPDTGKPMPMHRLAHVGPAQQFFNANCLTNTQTRDFIPGGGAPYAIYSGTRYGTNINNGPPNLPYCGYDAPQVDKAYGLDSLYREKLDGTGQTVVIVDAFGSDTIQSDANVFAQINGLPQLDVGNFAIYYPEGPPSCGTDCVNGNWNIETSLDVEWSHSVAPGASIALVLSADNSLTNLDLSVLYAIENEIGPVISNSYGIGEIILATYLPSELTVENNLNETGAALGISVNFSSADSGDFYSEYGVTTVSMPASSPYATGVGGTSLFLNPDHSLKLQTGWGNNETRIASYAPNPPMIPPLEIGFVGGSGGGSSGVWSKPSFQGSLPGSARLVPDIAFLADPFTGVEVVLTEPGGSEPEIGVVGGTSLACPMFSAIWAISTQAAGASLGQAASILYSLPADAINDVVATNGPDNVSGITRTPPNPAVTESADALAAPLGNTTEYLSALFNGTSTRWYVLTFGTDSSLTTGPGWDNVTGLGTPNGANFVTAVAGAK